MTQNELRTELLSAEVSPAKADHGCRLLKEAHDARILRLVGGGSMIQYARSHMRSSGWWSKLTHPMTVLLCSNLTIPASQPPAREVKR